MRYLTTFLALYICPTLINATPTGWRGSGTGVFENTTPPTEWAEGKNVTWKTKLPNWSNSSPILVNDRIFVCAEPATLLCVSAADGAILWTADNPVEDTLTEAERNERMEARAAAKPLQEERKKLEKASRELKKRRKDAPEDEALKAQEEELQKKLGELKKKLGPLEKKFSLPGCHRLTGYSTGTPVSDGKNVYVAFGTTVVASYDLEGKRTWIRRVNIGACKWGHAASPLLAGDTLIISGSPIVALNTADGSERWKTKARSNNGTPALLPYGSRMLLVTTDGQVIDTADGLVVAEGLSSLPYNAPVTAGDTLFFFGVGDRTCKAVRLSVKEGSIAAETLWETEVKKGRYYGSPVVHDGIIYGIRQSGTLSALATKTGEKLFEKQIDFGKCQFYPSLAIAGGKLYAMADNGHAQILEPGAVFKEVAQARLEKMRSSPFFAGKSLYLRGLDHLYRLDPAPAE